MLWTTTLCCLILVATAAAYNFPEDYLASSSAKVRSHLQDQDIYDSAETHRTDRKAKKGNDLNLDYYNENEIPAELVAWVCTQVGHILEDGDTDCSSDLMMSSLGKADHTELAELLLELIIARLQPVEQRECLMSMLTVGSLYYITTEQLHLEIYMTFYSTLMRTMLLHPVPAQEIFKVHSAAHDLVEHFWWEHLGSFLDEQREHFNIKVEEWGHEITNNQLTNDTDGLSYSHFPEQYLSVRKVLVRQVFYAKSVLDTFHWTLTEGDTDCTGLGEEFIEHVKALDKQLNESFHSILYNETAMAHILQYSLGEVINRPDGYPIVESFQRALQANCHELQRAANLFRPLETVDRLDELVVKAFKIFFGYEAQSVQLWTDIFGILNRLHWTIGSDRMNTHFYELSSTDMTQIMIEMFLHFERFADASLSKKMADIGTGILEFKRFDFSMMSPLMWSAGDKLVRRLEHQNNNTFNGTEAWILLEEVLCDIYLDNLNICTTAEKDESAAVYLPLKMYGLLNMARPHDMNHMVVLFSLMALPVFQQEVPCNALRVTPKALADTLRCFINEFENGHSEAGRFAAAGTSVGKTWEVHEMDLWELFKLSAPTLFEDVRVSAVILERFDSSQTTSTVVGSVLASTFHEILWILAKYDYTM